MTSVNPPVNMEALKSEIRQALIDSKAFACPIAMRVAWHASGTFDVKDGTGGSDGATMRFLPEKEDPANAGLSIVRDMLHGVKKNHPEVTEADLWTLAGVLAVEFMGGPKVEHHFGRSDAVDGKTCPAHGRLPDAAQGAQHLRDVFYRMGFNDQEIVALSGGHTVGRCHLTRSGFDGPWTRNSLRFDNAYFKNLVNLTWQERKWEGKQQFEDKETQQLMMLPTDIALITDKDFKVWVDKYAKDQKLFFDHFAKAYGKLMALGCPAQCQPEADEAKAAPTESQKAGAEFRERSMHGSLEFVQALASKCDPHELEASSGRSALHKAAFWGHDGTAAFLISGPKLNPNVQDKEGDTALHDACRFGHKGVVEILAGCTNRSLKNKLGQTPKDVAVEYGKEELFSLLDGGSSKL